MARSRRYWIQRAIEHPTALTRWLKRGGARKIASATRKPVWTKSGEINTNTLKSFRKTEAYKRLPTRIKRRINLAITLERLNKRPKRRRRRRR